MPILCISHLNNVEQWKWSAKMLSDFVRTDTIMTSISKLSQFFSILHLFVGINATESTLNWTHEIHLTRRNSLLSFLKSCVFLQHVRLHMHSEAFWGCWNWAENVFFFLATGSFLPVIFGLNLSFLFYTYGKKCSVLYHVQNEGWGYEASVKKHMEQIFKFPFCCWVSGFGVCHSK